MKILKSWNVKKIINKVKSMSQNWSLWNANSNNWPFVIKSNEFFLYFQNYFGDAWNTTDFILVVGSIIDIVVTQVNENKPNVSRLLKIVTIFNM